MNSNQFLLIILFNFLVLSVSAQTMGSTCGIDATNFGCSGVVYDSGGAAGDYGNSEIFRYSVCSDDGSPIDIVLNYDTEATFDFVEVYDGSNIYEFNTFNLTNIVPSAIYTGNLVMGSYTGANVLGIPALLTTQSGCFTVVFSSDNTSVAPGFDLTWTAGGGCAPGSATANNGDGANTPGPHPGNDSSPSNDFCGTPVIYDGTVGAPGNVYTNQNTTSGSGVDANGCDPDGTYVTGQTTLEATVYFQYCTTGEETFVDAGVNDCAGGGACVGFSLFKTADGTGTPGNACFSQGGLTQITVGTELNNGDILPASTCYIVIADGLAGQQCDFCTYFQVIAPVNGYWINNPAAPAPSYSTCPNPVITDSSGRMYDQGGPDQPTPSGQSQVVSVCPEGAATVDLTITYDLQDPNGTGAELVAIYDDRSRNDGQNELGNVSGVGTASYTTTGPCFTILYQTGGGEGFQIDWSVNTPGAGSTFAIGDLCDNPYLITDTNTPLAVSSIAATSGPVYNGGVLVDGTGCDPDFITDGCTTTVENTIFATFTSCAAGGPATLTLSGSNCNSTGQTPQMFLYTGTCGSHTFVDCVGSQAAGGAPTLTATLAPNTEYTIAVDGFRGIECDFNLGVTGCISTCNTSAGTNGTLDVNNNGASAVTDLFSGLGGTPDPGGIWEDTSGFGIDISNPANVDFTGVPAGSYIFTYTVLGSASCPDASSQVIVNVTSGTSPYCIPDYTYYEPLANYIYGVELGCIQNVGTGHVYGPPYTDYTQMSTVLEAGSTTTITLYSSSAGTEINVTDTWAEVWIDYDDNGIFSESESLLQYHFTNDVASVSLPIFIQDNGSYGERRLRVRYTLSELAGPCGNNSCGEAEDYTVFIAGGIVGPESGCQNEPLLFHTDIDLSGATYQWLAEGNPGISLQNQANGSIEYEWSESGSYNVTLQVTFADGCTRTYSEQIEIQGVEVGIVGPDNVCSGRTILLYAASSQNGTYVWDGEGITNNNAESIIINAATLAPGIYTYCVTLTNDEGCAGTICKDVEVLAKPWVEIIGPNTVCQGDDVELVAESTAGGTYTWFGEGITGNGQSAIINTANLAPDTYSYTVSLLAENGCSDITAIYIEVLGNPTAEICEPTTILLTCTDTEITLDATCSTANGNGVEYSWSGPNGNMGTDPSQSVTEPGLYIVAITDVQNGCSHSDSIEIMESLPPEVAIYHNGCICEGDPTSLFAYTGSFDGNYLWTGQGITTANENDNPIYLSALSPGVHSYDVIYTDEYGCTATDFKEILVMEAPDAGIGGSSSDVCSSGDTVRDLMAEIGGTPDPGTWEDTDNSGVDLSDPANVDFSGVPAGSYTFTFIVEGSHFCEDASSEIEVNVFSADAGTDGSAEICNSGDTELNLPQQLGGTPDTGGNWSDADNSGANLSDPTSADFAGVAPGSYTFIYTVQGIFPCADVSSVVEVNVIASAVEIIAAANSICEGEPLELLAENPNGSGNYTWAGNGVTLSNSSDNPLLLTNLPAGTHTYTVSYTNEDGCTATDSQTITVIQAPNAGISNSIDICRGESTVIYFYDLLGGIPDLGGKWTDTDNSGVDLSDITNVDFANIPDGSYTFTYTVEGTAPCADASAELEVNISSVDAGDDGTAEVCNNGDTVNLPSNLEGTPDLGGTWEDSDNSGVDLSDPANVDFTGVAAGSYAFIYIAAGTAPCSDDTSRVIVDVSEILTDFCYEINGNTATISNNSTGSAALSYHWDFGDGTTSTEENPVHTYDASGQPQTYGICLTATFEDGTICSYTCCKEITVYPPCRNNIPGPTFNYVLQNNGYVKFMNPSGVGNAYTKEWTINGVFHSDVNQPPAKILSPGIHRVCLTVARKANTNCSETFCRDIIVNDPCTVPLKIEFNYETCIDSRTFLFESVSIGAKAGATIHWDFGNGDTATGNTAQYTYPDYGSYMLCLNVSNSENCSKKVCGIIEVAEPSCTNNPASLPVAAKDVADHKESENELVDEINGGAELQIIPNPASNMVKAVFSEIQSDKATVTLSDINGKTITRTALKKGTRNYEFDVSDWPAGVYIMTLQETDGKKISSKIMKI